MLENCDKIIHFRFNFNACPMHQDLSAHALFCHNSLTKVNMQLLIYKLYSPCVLEKNCLFMTLPQWSSPLINCSPYNVKLAVTSRQCDLAIVMHASQYTPFAGICIQFIHSNLISCSLIGSLVNTRSVLKMSTVLRVLRQDCAQTARGAFGT